MVMMLGNLMKISDMVIRKGVNILDAARVFMLFVPYILGFTLPLAFLLGVLLTMGRLISDNEITAINVAGISLFKILNIFLILGIMSSLFLFILNDKVIPGAQYRYRSQVKGVYSKNISALIEPGVFLENFQNYVLYVTDKEGNRLKNIFIYEVNETQGASQVIFAKHGEFVVEGNILKMKLEDGFRDQTKSDNKRELYRLNFKILFVDIPIEEKKTSTVKQKPCDMRLDALRSKIEELRSKGINPVELILEFHKRISFSFSIITFILLGFGVSLAVKHREKTINFGIALVAAGIYYLLFILGQTLVENHILIPFVGMWIPNIVIASVGAYFIFKNAHR
jgi:lipopolysaccharide export system permease protein